MRWMSAQVHYSRDYSRACGVVPISAVVRGEVALAMDGTEAEQGVGRVVTIDERADE